MGKAWFQFCAGCLYHRRKSVDDIGVLIVWQDSVSKTAQQHTSTRKSDKKEEKTKPEDMITILFVRSVLSIARQSRSTQRYAEQYNAVIRIIMARNGRPSKYKTAQSVINRITKLYLMIIKEHV